jgi:hypothetical protein
LQRDKVSDYIRKEPDIADSMNEDHDDELLFTHEERRQHDRSRIIVDVYFDGTDATGIASTKDISTGGLYMNTDVHLAAGTKLMLRIPSSGDFVVVEAEVVFSELGSGVGVRFKNLTEQDIALIDRLKQLE